MKNIITCRVIRWFYQEISYIAIEWFHRLSSIFNRRIGVTSLKRNPELIVSLTSIPERISKLNLCLDSLLRQSLKPDRIILWLSESFDSDKPSVQMDNLPQSLIRLKKRGLEIRWCKDIRSYRKIIPTICNFPNALIVTADDDIFYPRHWLQDLYTAYEKEPQYIHCHRAHLMKRDDNGALLPYKEWSFLSIGFQGPSLDLFPTGVGGVLYAPDHLHSEVLNESVFLDICLKADDVWLKAMSYLNNIPCKKIAINTFNVHAIRIKDNRELCTENYEGDGNDQQIKAIMSRYGVFGSLNAYRSKSR